MEFHIARKARDRYGVSDVLFSYAGNVVFANVAASRELALRVNQIREAEASVAPAQTVHAAALFAMGLIDELSHALVAKYRETLDPAVLPEALRWFGAQMEVPAVDQLLRRFTADFPNVAVYRGELTVDQWLAGTTEGMSNREAAFEEMLLLWLANINPAFAPFREFFDDTALESKTVYPSLTAKLDSFFATRPAFDPALGSLLDALRAPMLVSPDSLTGQLEYIREQWVEQLGEDVKRVLLAIDVVKEEDVAIWTQFHPASAARQHAGGQQGWSSEGFEGDEFVGFGGEWYTDAQGVRRFRPGSGSPQQPTIHEYEAFSPDQAWMPTVVLIAKSSYVWLEQLSKKYQRHIHRLDQIPDDELALLADRGLNGLWLIGLWERSTASQTIKRLRGQADAVASAYSVADYRIAEDLGGEDGYRVLRDNAARHGIRLASDMVPNHMGIDSTWVMEHPEWFVSRDQSPFPSYSFEGPDLSHDSRYEIKIDDHYYDQTDAAVVFRLRNRSNGHAQFLYHGNDGTTFAWNDTAQLDYSKAYVREQVMQTILAVARLFPIIRFDAAMTLAKKHVQRLWFPLHGTGGSIPSRAENAMTNEEFDALMPNEFWREVVDRVAVEVPGTLLLAEAFWLLEGYFVRTLGMHRVYNSAFMNMLRDEENAKYRSYLKKTIEFDPDILKRYVNFMSNPDERTAIDQFGTGDRYFGVCTLLATIPGLPMFGHGQIEAFTEKYGMEYKTAKFDEYPNEDLVARHQREIAPLLKNRRLYAESEHFVLYDFWTTEGTVDENVFAYSNRLGDERAVIFFNNHYGETRGTIHVSAESMDKGSGTLRTRMLGEALALRSDDALVVAYKDTVSGLEYLRRSRSLNSDGVTIGLRAYQYVVLQGWRELRSTTEQPWDALCDSLNGAGVYNLDEALSKLRLRPLQEALNHLLSAESIQPFLVTPLINGDAPAISEIAPVEPQTVKELVDKIATEEGGARKLEVAATTVVPINPTFGQFVERATRFLDVCQRFTQEGFTPVLEDLQQAVSAAAALPQLVEPDWPAAALTFLPLQHPESASRTVWAQVLAYTAVAQLQSVAVFDDLQLRSALAETLTTLGLESESAWRTSARVRLLLAYPEPLEDLLRSETFWGDPNVRWLAGVTEFEGTRFLNKESLEELVSWLLLPTLLGPAVVMAPLDHILAAAKDSDYKLQAFIDLLTPAAPVTEEPEQREPQGKSGKELPILGEAPAPAEAGLASTRH